MVDVQVFRRKSMSVPPQPNIRLINSPEYRDGYANSVQVRVSVWDFLLVFGRLQPLSTQEVEVQNFQGIYLSPQQAKALVTILEQNVRQYENTFGEIKLDPGIAQQQGQIN
jgi:flagellar protein FlaG